MNTNVSLNRSRALGLQPISPARRFIALGIICTFLVSLVTGNTLATISMDFVTVGNPDNAADLATGYGSVGYIYGIGKYEVTLAQYTDFLNAVASTDTYGLYNPSMGTKLYIAGISQSGVAGSYSYSVIGSGNRPVTFVSWFDAARFANWMHNGQPVGSQTSATTEDGAYTLNGATNGVFFRNAGARYSIPSEDEWYKAAYYDPSLNSGNGGYWLYPTRSNTQPNSRNGSTTDPNSANYYFDDSIANGFNGGYAVTDSTKFFSSQNHLTEVGAFALASSFYGTLDYSLIRTWRTREARNSNKQDKNNNHMKNKRTNVGDRLGTYLTAAVTPFSPPPVRPPALSTAFTHKANS